MIAQSVKNILLVEDSLPDARLVQLALKQYVKDGGIWLVEDGLQAMSFLRREGRFSDAPAPDLILLDLNLPLKDGREVLTEIREDPTLTHLPVAILTTSESDEDVLASYKLHANCYIVKRGDLGEFIEAMGSLHRFWNSVSVLPPRASATE